MKILIYDQDHKTRNFLIYQFKKLGKEILYTSNRSKFISLILNLQKYKINTIILNKNELNHYNCNESTFFQLKNKLKIVISFENEIGHYINNINLVENTKYDNNAIKKNLNKIIQKCRKPKNPQNKIINKLSKKSAILFQKLLNQKDKGLSDKEIAKLFWGNMDLQKKHCIYNHIYHLRKLLKTKFNNSYIIHKTGNRYMLIDLKHEA